MINFNIDHNDKGHLKCKELTSLYDINQELKKISTKYYIDCYDGLCVHVDVQKDINSDNISLIMNDAKLSLIQNIFSDSIIEMDSRSIFDLFKLHKKNMDYLYTNEYNDIYIKLLNGDDIRIGKHYPVTNTEEYTNIYNKINLFRNMYKCDIESPKTFIQLNDEQVYRISEDVLKCKLHEINLRIAKSLIPGINTKFKVWLSTEQINVSMSCLYILYQKDFVRNLAIFKIVTY